MADMRFVKPLDLALLDELAKHHDVLLSVEEGAVQGGIGEEIARYFEERSYSCRVLTAGIPDEFEMEDSRSSILKRLKLDPEGILERVRNFLV